MEQNVLLLDENQSQTPEATPVVLDENVATSPGLPRLFWAAISAITLNVMFAVALYATATPGKPLPSVAHNDPELSDGSDFTMGPKMNPVGDGSDAGPRSRLSPLPLPKARPTVETTVSAVTPGSLALPTSTVPDFPRSSTQQLPSRLQSPLAMPRSSSPEMPRSSEAAVRRSSEPAAPARPRSAFSPNAAQAAADNALQNTFSSPTSSRKSPASH